MVFRVFLMCLVLALSQPSFGDIVAMNDGRYFTGIVVEETPQCVTIDTVTNGIRSTLKLLKRDIASVSKGELPENFFKQVEKGEAERPTEIKNFVVVPFAGLINECDLRGFRSALFDAKARRIPHVVLLIDSMGGDEAQAHEIALTIEKHRKDFKFYAFVHRAVGASIWIAFSCETLFVKPTSIMGNGSVKSVVGRIARAFIWQIIKLLDRFL